MVRLWYSDGGVGRGYIFFSRPPRLREGGGRRIYGISERISGKCRITLIMRNGYITISIT